ncbi:MAG: DNA alkylation repair protein [Oceanospirillaceae bacterium]|nr:DNA alkylation repair protein [Oceanospirillaceae bacterium]
MAPPLKHLVGPALAAQLAHNVALGALKVDGPKFDKAGFTQAFSDKHESLELMPRCHLLADCLYVFLPKHYPHAVASLIASLGPVHPCTTDFSDVSFLHLPFSLFVGKYGLEYFEESMAAQYEITQRFSAEFSIRAFIQRYRAQCFELFQHWIRDPNPHIRRLVSEGTRPRLPWASRLVDLQEDPSPIIPLLEALKDDPELYVRRSVANNLNDIGKDHPQRVYELLAQWQKHSNKNRDWVITHALRSAVKRCEPGALALLGYKDADDITLSHSGIVPMQANVGESVKINATVGNIGGASKALMVDFAVHYVKANGKPRAKVFKWRHFQLEPSEKKALSKKLNLANLSTRTHFAGLHRVDIIINGHWFYLGTFELS